jgi:predicted dehydrogenase
MAIDLTPEQKEIGKANFQRVVGAYLDPKSPVTRRDFMKGLFAASTAVPISAAAYFGYTAAHNFDRPVKAALIGAGDEGGVLIGEHNPKYLEFVACCDIRPSNKKRIFEDEKLKNPNSPRRGFVYHYGKDAAKKIAVYESYQKMLEELPDIEAVVIALPLNLHAPVAIKCMQIGKDRRKPVHVLSEKLMAWNIGQCKEMIKKADETDSILSIGHQRHYSMLYAHAVEVLNSEILGDVRHIRALWHRNNSVPRTDERGNTQKDPKTGETLYRDSWRPDINKDDRQALESRVKEFGFKSIEELVRWRIFNRTGGGLMAELGSHQLDACSIFLGKVHPLAVSGVGTKSFYREQYKRGEREVDDHVFVTYEFPGKNYFADTERKAIKDKDDVVVVTYSSINTNAMEGYGECIMGNKGSLIVHQEQDIMLYPERGAASRSTSVSVTAGGGGPVLDTSASGPPGAAAAAIGQAAMGSGPPSKGYREEMEHFAYCVRMWQEGASKQDRPLPRCHGRVAMADAIIALSANLAMKRRQRIEFKKEWFDAESKEVPDGEMVVEAV